ncbi:rho GTPase-activating protein 31 isoform 2-T2 [Discoglossus pictus]
MKNKGAKTKFKRKGSSGAFGCDLTEYLESSGQDVPLVLKSCAEFIETHGVVDGIYRLSGVTSNIQKLRQEFGSDQCPDLTREVYLQDIHCVGSLCKLYFRELPNPLLTYQLYKKFTDAVSCSVEGEQLSQIQNVIQELPPSHYRTLEYLSKHLTHIASFSTMTNMHIRNLALVWAPNLLRSKEIEDAGCNGDAAFLEVRVQQVVLEFILNHVEQIFNKKTTCSPRPSPRPRDECRVMMKSMTLPTGSLPMKLVSLEEAQARSLAATHPARKERRENSLPEIVPVTGTMFHTVIDLPENKRKLSTKSKKWKSIFNLGRSGSESKSKLSRNGSVFVRGQKEMNEKATIRPAKSMDSLCSLPAEGEDEKMSRFKRSVATGGFFIPVLKSRTTGTGSTFDLSKHDNEWETGEMFGATGGSGSTPDKSNPKSPQVKSPPEQMKVFRVGEELDNEQTSPKIRKMFYASSDGPAKSSFPGSLFPLEASPRHQRKALNISEPFAVSVPLRVSAVISSNSTPCRATTKERHLLSSLEELPLLEPDNLTKSTVSDTGLKVGSNSAQDAKLEGLDIPLHKDVDTDSFTGSDDDKLMTLNEILMETMLLPTEQLEVKAVPIKEKDVSVSVTEKTEGSEADGPNKDSVTQQVETSSTESADPFHNDRDDDVSLNMLDPLWPDIQQELKIIESEEELPESPPEINLIPSPSTQTLVLPENVHPIISSDGFQESPVLPEVNNEVDVTTSVPHNPCMLEENESCKHQTQTNLENILGNTSLAPQEIPDGNYFSLPQESQPQDIQVSDVKNCQKSDKQEYALGFLKPIPVKQKIKFTQGETKRLEVNDMQVISENVPVRREEDRQTQILERKSSESLENDDELVHTFELEDSWEDHQWVTSPLHSPKLKNVFEKEINIIQPKRRGTTGQLYKRPEFTRSLSLDSKDTRTSQWTLRLLNRNKPDGLIYLRSETDNLMKETFQKDPEKLLHGRKKLNLLELPATGTQNDIYCRNDETDKTQTKEHMPDIVKMKTSGSLNCNLQLPALPLCSVDGQSKLHEENMQPAGSSQEYSIHSSNNNSEHGAEKPKTRPSSLILDTTVPTGDFFTFENVATPLSIQGEQIQKTHEVTRLSPLDSPKYINQWKDNSWRSQLNLQNKDTELDHMSHTSYGRRNSAPVSVSAIRASFMIKMCQAKAVPVIPPKVQYTEIPQPLQTVSIKSDIIPIEKKEKVSLADCHNASKQTISSSKGQSDIPKSPKPEKKCLEEKENSDPVSLDSSHHSSFNSPTESSRTVSQDVPVLRRKRISDGEVSEDTPLSSKIERPSGLSRPSFRRPGRPQSLILFSPPFPIMDHPLTADSRILLSPIKSPVQTTSQESSFENQKTPDGVILRNKLTIPKNGQRLETSTSCFYQPQRRSVILDSRSGRQFE